MVIEEFIVSFLDHFLALLGTYKASTTMDSNKLIQLMALEVSFAIMESLPLFGNSIVGLFHRAIIFTDILVALLIDIIVELDLVEVTSLFLVFKVATLDGLGKSTITIIVAEVAKVIAKVVIAMVTIEQYIILEVKVSLQLEWVSLEVGIHEALFFHSLHEILHNVSLILFGLLCVQECDQ